MRQSFLAFQAVANEHCIRISDTATFVSKQNSLQEVRFCYSFDCVILISPQSKQVTYRAIYVVKTKTIKENKQEREIEILWVEEVNKHEY